MLENNLQLLAHFDQLPVKILNIGNTCYFSSALLLLRRIDRFVNKLLAYESQSFEKYPFTKELRLVMGKLLWSFNPIIDPSNLVMLLPEQFSFGELHVVMDVLRVLLDPDSRLLPDDLRKG